MDWRCLVLAQGETSAFCHPPLEAQNVKLFGTGPDRERCMDRRKHEPQTPGERSAQGEAVDYGTVISILPELSTAQSAVDVATRQGIYADADPPSS